LRRALASVAAQRFVDYEVVLVNDGGAVEPVEAAVAGSGIDDRVVLVRNVSSVGREAAVNVGAARASGRYLVVLDDDDSWHPAFLERTTTFLDSSDDLAVAVRVEVVRERVEGDVITETSRETLAADMRRIGLVDILYGNYIPTMSLLLRRNVFDEIGGWNSALPVQADWAFNMALLSRGTVGFIDGEPLAFWHWRVDAEGALGNSVHLAAHEHVDVNLAIRDDFLREYIATGRGLGALLMIAESSRRLSAELAAAHDERQEIMRVQELKLAENLSAGLGSLRESIESMRAHLNALDHLLHSIDEGIERTMNDRWYSRFARTVRRGDDKKGTEAEGDA